MIHFFKRLLYPENYIYRLYALAVVLIVGGVIIHNLLQYRAISEEVDQLAYREAKLLDNYYASIRRVYSNHYLNALSDVNEASVALLPVHAASPIGEDFRRHASEEGIMIRNVSDNARNLQNAPVPFEQEAIAHFKRHPEQTEFSRILRLEGRKVLFYASPIKIEPYCLMCHGRREEAPAYVRENCINGYDYQIGDVRGIVSIAVEQNPILADVREKYTLYFLYSGVIAAAILFVLFMIVRRAKKIERRLLGTLKRLSYKDTLTNLCNRRRLNTFLEEHHHLYKRYNDPYSLIMIDIDHFKEVNDTYGHSTGDSVLREMARILRTTVRKTDHAGRWGGEEFLILCPKTTLAQAEILAQALREKIAGHPFKTVGHKTASLGVVQILQNEELHDLIERVDAALYQAKKSGRNRVSISRS